MKLAYVAHQLPGTASEREEHARRLDLAVEVADGVGPDVPTWQRAGLEVITLQAYGMHEWHPLHRDVAAREQSVRYVLDVLERAALWEVPNVLTACGFHPAVPDQAFERALEFYGVVGERARELGVHVLIESLSPLRAGALTDPYEVDHLIGSLGDNACSAAIDTGHLLDGGHEPLNVMQAWRSPVGELQLRGARSHPPAPDTPFQRWIETLPNTPDVVTFEHCEPISVAELEALVTTLRAAL